VFWVFGGLGACLSAIGVIEMGSLGLFLGLFGGVLGVLGGYLFIFLGLGMCFGFVFGVCVGCVVYVQSLVTFVLVVSCLLYNFTSALGSWQVCATSEILGAKIACEGARHRQEPYTVPRWGVCCVNVKHVLGLLGVLGLGKFGEVWGGFLCVCAKMAYCVGVVWFCALVKTLGAVF